MADKFHLYVKSSIDKKAFDLATEHGLPLVDLDSAALVAEMLDTDATAVVWAMGMLTEAPTDPLWFIDFDIGVKTSHDPAQYVSLDVTSMLSSAFKVRTTIPIHDYTGDVPDPDEPVPTLEDYGEIYITAVSTSAAQSDRLSGIRMINVQARVLRR